MALMHKVFAATLDKFDIFYLEYIFIYIKTVEEHLQHIEIVLKKLHHKKLHENLFKCKFAVHKVEYLG